MVLSRHVRVTVLVAAAIGAGCHPYLNRLLSRAVAANSVTEVKRLLAEGADPNYQSGDGQSLLAVAVYKGEYVIAEELVDRGANIKIKIDGFDPLALISTVPQCRPSLVRAFIKAGADPSSPGEINPPLYGALLVGANQCASELIELGAKIDPPHIAGLTMLHAAASGASPELVLMLINRGLDVNARAKKGFTPLMGAAGRHDNDDQVDNVIQVLLDHGADPCAKMDTGVTATAAALRANKEERATRLAAACKSWNVARPKA